MNGVGNPLPEPQLPNTSAHGHPACQTECPVCCLTPGHWESLQEGPRRKGYRTGDSRGWLVGSARSELPGLAAAFGSEPEV